MPQIHPQKSRESYISWNQPDSARVRRRIFPRVSRHIDGPPAYNSSIGRKRRTLRLMIETLWVICFIRSTLQYVHAQTESIYIYPPSNEIYTSFMKNKFIEIHTEHLFKTSSQKLVNLVHHFFRFFTMLHYMQLPVPTEVDTISGNALLAACRNARRWREARMKWIEIKDQFGEAK